MKNWWVGFWILQGDLKHFEYHGPWWRSGERGDEVDLTEHSICAAVHAESERAAKKVIEDAFDKGHYPSGEFRFVSERDDKWAPWTDRFKAAPWMKWPWPVVPSPSEGEKK